MEKQVGLIIQSLAGSNTYALYRYLKDRKDVIVTPVYMWFFYNLKKEIAENIIKKIHSLPIVLGTHYHVTFKSISNIYIEMTHGFPMKSILLLDSGLPIDKAEKIRRYYESRIDFYLALSEFNVVILNSGLGSFRRKYVITGYPRNDLLFHCKKNVIFSKLGIPTNKKVVIYMPTYRKSSYGNAVTSAGLIANLLNVKNFDFEELLSFLELNDILIIIKVHELSQDFDNIELPKTSNIIILKNDDFIRNKIELYELLACADLLMTDYSSVYIDFLLTDKPMIFIPTDINLYRKQRGLLLEPYDEWTPGPKVTSQRELFEAVLELLKNPDKYQEDRIRLKKIMHKFHDDKSSERVWNFVETLF